MTDLDFSNQTLLVVGGSSGIGNGIAHAFRDRGADVYVWGTRPTAADYGADEGSNLVGLHYSCVDVGDADAIDAWCPAFDTLDILVLCQGIVVYRRAEFDRPDWDRVMAVNLDSLMGCARKFRGMLASGGGGALIIVSSISGFRANIGNPAYAASKAAAVSLTKTLGAAWAPENIRVNGIAPGFVDTKLTTVTVQNPRRRDQAVATIPLGRLGVPADMAGAALFLASPLASYVVGHTLVVDGGITLA